MQWPAILPGWVPQLRRGHFPQVQENVYLGRRLTRVGELGMPIPEACPAKAVWLARTSNSLTNGEWSCDSVASFYQVLQPSLAGNVPTSQLQRCGVMFHGFTVCLLSGNHSEGYLPVQLRGSGRCFLGPVSPDLWKPNRTWAGGMSTRVNPGRKNRFKPLSAFSWDHTVPSSRPPILLDAPTNNPWMKDAPFGPQKVT